MILKLCFQNEIHRCSSPPQSLSELQALLGKIFRTQLPQKFSIYYTIPNVSEKFLLETQEDYALLLSGVSETVRVFLQDNQESQDEEPKIIDIELPKEANENIQEGILKVEDKQDFVEILAEDVASRVQRYPYFAHNDTKEEELKRMVKMVLREELPFIISQVKEAVLQELKPVLQPVIEKRNVSEAVQVKEEAQEVGSQRQFNEVVAEEMKPVINNLEIQKRNSNNIFSRVRNFGKSIRNQFVGLPRKAKNSVEDKSQRVESDSIIEVEEGKYSQSVVDKANELKEIFPDESMRKLLEIVDKCPRYASVLQLADYIIRNGEEQENRNEAEDENDENVAEENGDKSRYEIINS